MRNLKYFILFVLVVLIRMSFATDASLDDSKMFRTIKMPMHVLAYEGFESQVIFSNSELYTFFSKIYKYSEDTAPPPSSLIEPSKSNEGKSRLYQPNVELISILQSAKINFNNEALVLIQHSESSTCIKVKLDVTSKEPSTLICKVDSHATKGLQNMMWADYCFAVVFNKRNITRVELEKPGCDKNVVLYEKKP
ncbi:hypothetical protein K9N50_08140 [bacterium]|nr:hypothetical protein [bacterium]